MDLDPLRMGSISNIYIWAYKWAWIWSFLQYSSPWFRIHLRLRSRVEQNQGVYAQSCVRVCKLESITPSRSARTSRSDLLRSTHVSLPLRAISLIDSLYLTNSNFDNFLFLWDRVRILVWIFLVFRWLCCIFWSFSPVLVVEMEFA